MAERRIVPELMQEDATPDIVAPAIIKLLSDPQAHQTMREDLAIVRQRLGDADASAAVAELMHRLSATQ